MRFIVLAVLLASEQVLARERWFERSGRAVLLHPRRFGQEHPAVIQEISAACPGEVCGPLSGQAITPLLAAQPECSQQDLADAIIDASRQFDAATQAKMIALAIEYRQVEKNTPPDFTTSPPSLRNSVFCQKAPKNPELNGLVQAQDPANDPTLFFDPALGATVLKGSQPNTIPLGGAAPASSLAASATKTTTTKVTATGIRAAASPSTSCATAITITLSATNPAATDTNAVTITFGNLSSATASSVSPTATVSPTAGNFGNFGKCSVPKIEFGVGFDNRKETSFRPTDLTSYNHGSAQNIAIITQFICDTLTNTCGADQTAKATCAMAEAAAAATAPGTGAQADAFNNVFGVSTDFASVASVDNQGNVIPGTGNGAKPTNTVSTSAVTSTSTSSSSTAAPQATSGNARIGNFGSCSVPQIEFGAGFDGRKETSFQPADKTSFNHGSAQNIAIITQFICDTLTNSCEADQTAKATCATAQSTAAAATQGTGAQADAFNAVFGIQTNFASVTPIDDKGNAVGSGGGGGNNQVSGGAGATDVPEPTLTTSVTRKVAVTTTSTTPARSSSAAAAKVSESSTANSANLQTFTASLNGISAPRVTATSDGRFQVDGNAVINDKKDAVIRSCDVQHNACADAANASGNKNGFTVAACTAQQKQCADAASQ